MNWYSLSHLGDRSLLQGAALHLANEHSAAGHVLAHLAEIDDRRLYLPAAYPSMRAWCIGQLGMSDDVAGKRIQAARTARAFPSLFEAVADGRLSLSAVCMLAPHMTKENAGELIEAAARQPVLAIREMLEARFAAQGLLAHVASIALQPAEISNMPGDDRAETPQGAATIACEIGEQHATWHVGGATPHATTPSPGRRPVEVRILLDPEAQEDLRYAQDLLGHAVRRSDVGQVIARALKLLVRECEKQRFAATARPSRARRGRSANARHVPAEVRRTVWRRDDGRCTFVSEEGHRCEATALLEFDHASPVARGGDATAGNLRLRCRAHNQYTAEKAYGAGFMRRKREEARARAAMSKAQRAAEAEARARETAAREAMRAAAEEVVPFLLTLGCRSDQARRLAANAAEALPDGSLEARVTHAVRRLGPPGVRRERPAGGGGPASEVAQ